MIQHHIESVEADGKHRYKVWEIHSDGTRRYRGAYYGLIGIASGLAQSPLSRQTGARFEIEVGVLDKPKGKSK